MKLPLEERKKHSNTASRKPVEEKSVLFIEAYSGESGGDCTAILQEFIDDPKYADWKIVWALPNAIYIDERIERYKDRVRLVKYPSIDLIAAIQTSKIIFSTRLLPTYFVKRKGQTVVGLYPADSYGNWQENGDDSDNKWQTEINRPDFALQRSLVKTDVIYAETDAIEKVLASKYPQGMPFSIVRGNPLRYCLETRQSAEIVVSVSDEIIGPKYPDLETLFKQIKTRAIEHDKDVFFRISHSNYLKYQEENDPKVLSRTGSSLAPVCQDIGASELLITDKKQDHYDASQLGVPCILVTNDITSWDNLGGEEMFAGNWEEVCEQIDLFYQEKHTGKTGKIMGDVKLLLDEVEKISDNNGDNHCKGGCLLVVSPHLTHEAWKAINFVKDECDVEMLFRDDINETLWKCGDLVSKRTNIYCQIGDAVSTVSPLRQKIAMKKNELPLSEDDLKSEWHRMTGMRSFKKIYYIGEITPYWDKMMACSPSDTYAMMTDDEFADYLLEKVSNPVWEKHVKGIEQKSELDDDRVFHLASDGADILLLDNINNKENEITLIIINKKSDVEKCSRLIEDKDRTYLIFDPHELLAGHKDITENDNVRWMPLRKFPLRALLVSDRVAFPGDSTLRKIAEHYGKEIIGEEKKSKEKMSEYIALLACEDICRMVSI